MEGGVGYGGVPAEYVRWEETTFNLTEVFREQPADMLLKTEMML